MRHGAGCTCCQCRPTPDEMPFAHRADRFDRAPRGEEKRSVAPEIDKNELGLHCHLDSARGDVARRGGHLGTGSDSVKDAARSIDSGAIADKVEWGPLSRIRGGKA